MWAARVSRYLLGLRGQWSQCRRFAAPVGQSHPLMRASMARRDVARAKATDLVLCGGGFLCAR